MRRSIVLTALVLLPLGGCPSASPAPGEAPGENMTGKKEQGMGNCPSAVTGARTKLILRDDGVGLEVTAPTLEGQREIRERAKRQAMLPRLSAAPRHSGEHGGPGTIGWCPVVHEATIITSSDVAGGVVIHVQARTADGVPALQQVTATRVEALAAAPPRAGPQ